VQVADATWRAAMRIVVGVGDLMQRIRDGRTSRILGGRMIGRSGDVICGLHRAHGDDERVFLVEPQNQGGGGFPGLGLKTGMYGLVIWDSKSPRQFLGLCLKTKHVSVYRLHHKTDGGRSARDTHQDLATCFTWKQV
jgi:hypothetical protein